MGAFEVELGTEPTLLAHQIAGVVDQAALFASYAAAAEANGAWIALKHELVSIERQADGFVARYDVELRRGERLIGRRRQRKAIDGKIGCVFEFTDKRAIVAAMNERKPW